MVKRGPVAQAIAERRVVWILCVALTGGMLWQAAMPSQHNGAPLD
jgi:hypothetical protein